MTDSEMIAWLRRQHATTHGVGFVALLSEAAARLEALASPPGKRPVTAEREAFIREWIAAHGNRNDNDLLVLLDHARALQRHTESVMADLASDNEALVKVGVAKALAVLRDLTKRLVVDDPHCHALIHAFRQIESRCDPAQLPPHEASLTRLRRLEAALVDVIRAATDPPESSQRDAVLKVAREALEESP